MKYAEQYLKEKVHIQPLGELKMMEEDGLEKENVFIDGMDTGISIYYCDYSSWLETKIGEMQYKIESLEKNNLLQRDTKIGEIMKDSFDVVLTEVGDDSKLAVIKAVKEACSLDLQEAKDLVDGVPSTLKEGLSKAEAYNIKNAIEKAGANVEIYY